MKWILIVLVGLLVTITTHAAPRTFTDPQFFQGVMTTTERNAMPLKRTNMIVYNVTSASFERYNGATWGAVGGGGGTDPTTLFRYYDDFIANPIPSSYTAGTIARTNGTGGVNGGGGNNDERNGILQLDTGVGATNHMSVLMGATTLSVTGGILTVGTGIKTGTNLSDGANTYRLTFGMSSDNTTITPVRGALISYDSSISPNWRLVSRRASVETSTTSSAVVAVDTKYNIKVVASETDVKFYVDGALLGTHTTNIPNVATDAMIAHVTIAKSVGTTSRFFEVDWIEVIKTFSPARK